jgi:hypothetical protein
MPSCPEFTPPTPPPMTIAEAQAALGVVALELLAAVDRLGQVYQRLPAPPDLADRQEGRKPYNVATDVLATIECVLADSLPPTVEALRRSAQITDAELERDYREWLKRNPL